MTHQARITRLHLVPDGQPIFSEMAYSVEIDDEAAGEFVTLTSLEESCSPGQVRIDPSDWPALRDAIDRMIGECKE